MIAHLAQQAEMLQVADAERAEARAEWEAERREKAALDQQVRFEAQRGCGLRLREPGVRSQFREGDIVYHPPPPDRSTQGAVAVVFKVHRLPFAPHLPIGEFNLLTWDVQRLKFARLERDVLDRDFVLFPPCCGRGAACEHLLLTQFGRWQWPNGDDLDLRVLRPIPETFSGLLNNELRAVSWQERRALQETFKTLLGPHYRPATAAASSAGASSSVGAPVHEHEHTHAQEHEHPSDGEVSVCDEPPDDANMYYDSVWEDSD